MTQRHWKAHKVLEDVNTGSGLILQLRLHVCAGSVSTVRCMVVPFLLGFMKIPFAPLKGDRREVHLIKGVPSEMLRDVTGEVESGAVGASVGIEGGPEASLVSPTNNSESSKAKCDNWFIIRGECGHENVRYRMVPCGRRSCPVCGPVGRRRIAERIALGVKQFWPCSWIVLTFKETDAEDPAWKKVAVRKVAYFVKQLRAIVGEEMQYAQTFELTKKGRLHCNLICGPWKYISQRELQRMWGARVWVERVKNSERVGREVAKAYSPESLGGYLSKLDQAVPKEWGRRCSFSKKWPKLGKGGLPREGNVKWRYCDGEERITFWILEGSGEIVEIVPGEYQYPDDHCDCFTHKPDPPNEWIPGAVLPKFGVLTGE